MFLWFWHKAHSEPKAESPEEDADHALIRDALKRLRASSRKSSTHFGDLPILIVLGESSAAKTTTVIRSGLDPDLLAGQVYQDDAVIPTEAANIWYTRSALLLDLGGKFLGQNERLGRMVRSLERSSLVKAVRKRKQSARAVIACISVESFLQPHDLASLARRLNASLQEITNSLGVNVPVYVVFTKLDRIASFAEYVRDLNNAEAAQVFGTTFGFGEQESGEVYAEHQTKLLTRAFDELAYSLADRRPEFLARVSESQRLAGVYEFPREFRKLRSAIVQFLVDALRPSHSPTNPLLRGYYFCGVRAVLEEQVAPAVAQSVPSADPAAREATMFFNAAAMKAAAQGAPAPVAQTRKVPQWTFLPHLFSEVILKDRVALGISDSSTQVNVARRIGVAIVAFVALVFCIGFTVSFFSNRSMRQDIASSAAAIPAGLAPENSLPSLQTLQRLDELRNSVETLQDYNHNGAPWSMRWGLYSGEELEQKARAIYFDRFYGVLFGGTQRRILASLKQLPAVPASLSDDYDTPYRSLKAYLITTSHHDKSTKEFLSPLLYQRWNQGRSPDPESAKLAQRQFDFYSTELQAANPYSSQEDEPAVRNARGYLSHFQPVKRIYRSLLDEVSRTNPAIAFDRDVVKTNHTVEGAFSQAGWVAMQDRITHHRFLSTEDWVMGPQTSSLPDDATLAQQLGTMYQDDFLNQWRSFLGDAVVSRYKDYADAATKLAILSGGNSSPLLGLLGVVSQNTAVGVPDISAPTGVFQPPASVVPPPGNSGVLVAPSNQRYTDALTALQVSMQQVSNTNGKDTNAVNKALQDATTATTTAMGMHGGFLPDHTADQKIAVDKSTLALLLAPIKNAETVLNGAGPDAANGAGKALCQEFKQFAGLYPFNPSSSKEADIKEVTVFFAPAGSLSKFYDEILKNYVTKSGTDYVPGPSGGKLNPAFLNFYNHAAHFSEAVYGQSPQPQLNFTLRPGTMDGMTSVVLDITGQKLASGGAPGAFTWRASDLDQITVTGDGLTLLQYHGPWALFHFFNEADKFQNNGSVSSVSWNPKTAGQPMTKAGVPVVIRYDVDMHGAPPIFQKGYLQQMRCDGVVIR